MSSNEEFGRRLAAAPLRELPAEARQCVVERLLEADTGKHRRWWSRRIALWQAVAACFVVACLTYATSWQAARIGEGRSSGTPGLQVSPSTVVSVEASVFGQRSASPYPTDITRWRAFD